MTKASDNGRDRCSTTPARTEPGCPWSWLFPDSGNGLLANANAGKSMGGDTADKLVLKALLPMVAQRVRYSAGR